MFSVRLGSRDVPLIILFLCLDPCFACSLGPNKTYLKLNSSLRPYEPDFSQWEKDGRFALCLAPGLSAAVACRRTTYPVHRELWDVAWPQGAGLPRAILVLTGPLYHRTQWRLNWRSHVGLGQVNTGRLQEGNGVSPPPVGRLAVARVLPLFPFRPFSPGTW